mmetsp:Transcript_62920/g.124387  ORF Transcript_62920/g.124387 Transcript_62920/m.124387 type:complete len:117 (+) Transcript_62920:31-381(+)
MPTVPAADHQLLLLQEQLLPQPHQGAMAISLQLLHSLLAEEHRDNEGNWEHQGEHGHDSYGPHVNVVGGERTLADHCQGIYKIRLLAHLPVHVTKHFPIPLIFKKAQVTSDIVKVI